LAWPCYGLKPKSCDLALATSSLILATSGLDISLSLATSGLGLDLGIVTAGLGLGIVLATSGLVIITGFGVMVRIWVYFSFE